MSILLFTNCPIILGNWVTKRKVKNKSKRKVERNLKKLNSPQIFANYTLNEFLPNKNEIFISGVDTHLNLVSRTKIDLNKNKKIGG